MKAEWKELISVAYDIIEEERLPRPKQIRFRSPLNGTRSRRGTCIKYHNNDEYRIIITTTEAKYVPDENGKYMCRETKRRMRRVIGTPIAFPTLVKTIAHEIAHLKFWRHDLRHRSYMEHILKKMNLRLGINEN